MAKEPKEQAAAEQAAAEQAAAEQAAAEQAAAEQGMTAEEALAALEEPGVSHTLGELQRLQLIAGI